MDNHVFIEHPDHDGRYVKCWKKDCDGNHVVSLKTFESLPLASVIAIEFPGKISEQDERQQESQRADKAN